MAEDGNPVVNKHLAAYAESNKCKVSVDQFELWTLKA
jgi:hypothetical protein